MVSTRSPDTSSVMAMEWQGLTLFLIQDASSSKPVKLAKVLKVRCVVQSSCALLAASLPARKLGGRLLREAAGDAAV